MSRVCSESKGDMRRIHIKSYSIFDLGIQQLESALAMYFQGNFFSAITLAGAAEEILGELVKRADIPKPIDGRAQALALVRAIHAGEDANAISDKDLQERVKQSFPILNRVKNRIKHLDGGDKDHVDCDPSFEAHEMIDRAISCYVHLKLPLTPKMHEFYKQDVIG